MGPKAVPYGSYARSFQTEGAASEAAIAKNATAAAISVNLVTVSFTAGNQNLISKTKTLQPAEVYTFPELVGQVLNPGDFISTLAGTATSINMRVSGREVS